MPHVEQSITAKVSLYIKNLLIDFNKVDKKILSHVFFILARYLVSMR